MGIGPFTTYAPPGVYTRTISTPVVGQLLGGLRIPVLIGIGQESLTQTDFEMIRGSSSVADTPIFSEDATGRWFISGTTANPVLGNQTGSLGKFRVRNYPVVDGSGQGKVTTDVTKVSVTVNGQQAIVGQLDGQNGYVTLLIPPTPTDTVLINYYFHRKDTRVTDDVSAQVTSGPAVLIAPRAEPYNIIAGTTDTLSVTVNDATAPVTITLVPGAAVAAVTIATTINSAAIAGLTASVHVDAQGLNHVQLIATGNILAGTGNANGALGFNPGDYTGRNTVFRVFNGPIVDGSDGGITTTDPSKVVVMVNATQVLAKAVDGQNQDVTLPFAPADGSIVTIQYYFNTWQDTFDYLPNNHILTVGNVGISPGRSDYLNGPDFVVINQGDQSIIQWGTAFQVFSGVQTGSLPFNSTQITGMLVDNRIYGAPCARFVDPTTAVVSLTKFVLPLSPTTGNGRDTPLGVSLYQTITNGRIDLPTNRPDLVTAYVGKTWRDALLHPPVTVLAVDSATNSITLATPVSADYNVYATFWYNLITDDSYTLNVVAAGPSGVGQYTISSGLTGTLYGARMGTKTGLAQTIQWPSGDELLPDAIMTGGGSPTPETVTVTFSDALDPATNASFSNANPEPYDVYTASSVFGGMVIDGNAPVSVDLTVQYKAVLLGQPIAADPINPAFLSTDYLVLNIDGVSIAPIALTGLTTLAQVATAINAAVDADTQVHADGSPTFASTAANALASVLTYGSGQVLKIKGRNLPTFLGGLDSNVTVQAPVLGGQTNGSAKVGLVPNNTAAGSYNAINQVAQLVGTQIGPYAVQAGVNDNFQLTVDGFDIGATIPAGQAVPLIDVVTAINSAYVSVASPADVATFTSGLVTLANDLKSKYNTHIASTVYHESADSTNPVSAANATDLPSAIFLLNHEKAALNSHESQSGVHQLNDTVNVVTAADAVDLATALTLAQDISDNFNAHLLQKGVHGHDDTVNVSSAGPAVDLASSEAVANDLKTQLNAHFTQSGVHLVNDVTNTITATNASDLGTTITLLNQEKAKFNAHIASTTYHTVADTTNTVVAPDATMDGSPSTPGTVEYLAAAIQTAYNAHRLQTEGASPTYHVHGTHDLANTETVLLPQLVAHVGAGVDAGFLVLTSRTNTVTSQVLVKATGSANAILGFVNGVSTSRVQPTAADIAGALNYQSAFYNLAVAYAINAPGLGNFLSIDSRTSGAFSTVRFTAMSNTTFIPDTGIGIVPGVSAAVGENAQAGFNVTSSAGAAGSHGIGFVGQTYTDTTTGLRFTILPANAGDYSDGGSFTLVVSPTFTCDASLPVRAVHGLELTVYNTLNMAAGTTSTVTTYAPTGASPSVGDVYYISYNYAKSDLTPQLYQDLKTIQQNFGTPTPDNPLSLGASLALLNGAVLIGLAQVLRSPGGTQAPVGAFTAAIDSLRKPLSGNVLPDVIAPLGTDPSIFAYLNQHCIFMSSPRQAAERIGVVGTAAGTSPLGVAAIAQGLSSELMILSYPDAFVIQIQDSLGNLTDTLVDGSFGAVAIAGSTCNPSLDVATPLTRRQILGFKQLGRIMDPTEANQTAVKGVTIIEQVSAGMRIRHGLTTNVSTVITRTPSVTLTIQFVQQQMRKVLDPFIGQKFTGALLKSIENGMTGAFGQMIDGQIVASVASISATQDTSDPTIAQASAIYVPVFPLEYILCTLNVRVSM